MLLAQCTYAHNAFTFNEHLSTVGVADRSKVNNTVVLDSRETRTGFRDLRDPYHLTTGGALGRSHKGFTRIMLSGRILVPNASQGATASDREAAMLAAFDPALCYRDSPTTEGAYALDFAEPTADTTTYATGWRQMRYYCRPDAAPQMLETVSDGTMRRFTVPLVAGDPRAYEQAEQTLSLSPGTPSGAVLNRGTVPAPIMATITMGGAGNAAFTITRGGVAFILNLSGMVAADVVVVVFETSGPYGNGKVITKNGASLFSLKTSAASTWLDAPVGSTVFTISNTTNVTSCVLAWRSARA